MRPEHGKVGSSSPESSCTTALRTLRLAVGDTGSRQQPIRTVDRRGCQFVAPVTAVGCHRGHEDTNVKTTPADGASGGDRHTVRFCRAGDGTRIAYAAVGSGPPLFKAANWMFHLDLEWTTPVWSHWLGGLARNRRLIRCDERGCPVSDWVVPGFSFDDWVADLETVVEAVGLDSFSPLGISQGGAVAVAHAVRHPGRSAG